MDAIDKKILELLQDNGRMTVKEITQTISLTAPAVSERIKRLEKDGVIEGYTAIVNPRKMGRAVHAIINVSVQPGDTEKLLNLVNNEPMVIECHHVTGAYSYLVKVDATEINLEEGKKSYAVITISKIRFFYNKTHSCKRVGLLFVILLYNFTIC